MSSEKTEHPHGQPSRETSRQASVSLRPTASIARSVTWSFTWRKLVRWLIADLWLVMLLALVFVWHCTGQLDAAALDGITYRFLSVEIVRPSACVFTGMGGDLATWSFVINGADGVAHSFPLLPFLQLVTPGLSLMLFCQVLNLFSVFSDTRRVRRVLQPLNDLAVAAEAIGQATATTDPMSSDKMSTLEQAIGRASVDSPNVSTGDRDLRSIEVALNGLLRQMQEAKLQQMRFVSDASHELRTPISVIQGYVNLLDRWGKTDESVLDESIEALKTESDHMQELVEQLLFLARGDSGRNTLNHASLNVAEMVHEVWDESCMIDESHTYECDVTEADLTDERFAVTGDLAMLKQSMRVIVQNAQKYSPADSTITLSARRTEDGVCYVVQDEGIGMSEGDARHIFERFWRADGARSEGSDGSGLGLSIAKWIIDAHEGTIEVVSRKGVGTRFTVRLPTAQR